MQRVYIEGSPVLKFRGSGIVDASVVKILALLQDVKNQKRWNKNTYNNRIVERLSDSELVVYNAAKIPFPFTDRDYLMKLKLIVDENKRHIVVKGAATTHPRAPEKKSHVRVKMIRTKWYFKPLKKYQGKKTWVDFTMHADPGGNMPNWLINFISKYIPRKTIENIRREVKKGKLDKDFLKKYARFENWY